jgi:hypothetical protein
MARSVAIRGQLLLWVQVYVGAVSVTVYSFAAREG